MEARKRGEKKKGEKDYRLVTIVVSLSIKINNKA